MYTHTHTRQCSGEFENGKLANCCLSSSAALSQCLRDVAVKIICTYVCMYVCIYMIFIHMYICTYSPAALARLRPPLSLTQVIVHTKTRTGPSQTKRPTLFVMSRYIQHLMKASSARFLALSCFLVISLSLFLLFSLSLCFPVHTHQSNTPHIYILHIHLYPPRCDTPTYPLTHMHITTQTPPQ